MPDHESDYGEEFNDDEIERENLNLFGFPVPLNAENDKNSPDNVQGTVNLSESCHGNRVTVFDKNVLQTRSCSLDIDTSRPLFNKRIQMGPECY